MNHERRAVLRDVQEQLVDASVKLSNAYLDEISSYQALPEGLKATANGTSMENAIECMSDAIVSIFDATNKINEIVE